MNHEAITPVFLHADRPDDPVGRRAHAWPDEVLRNSTCTA